MMDLDQTAIHEAGHAVAGYVLGLDSHSVELTHTVVEQLGQYGCVISANPVFGYEHETKSERTATMRAASLSCCAGLAAKHVFFEVPLKTDNPNAQTDFDNIVELERLGLPIPGKRGGCIGEERTWEYIAKTLRKARTMVRRHQALIRKLADVLVQRKQLSGTDVKLLLDEWSRPEVAAVQSLPPVTSPASEEPEPKKPAAKKGKK